MQLPTDFTSLTDVLQKLPQEKIAKILSVLLLGYIAYLCAELTWQLLPQKVFKNTIIEQKLGVEASPKTEQVDLSSIKQLNLFGTFSEQKTVTEVKVQDAPETKLRLTLSGTVASDEPAIAAAIIENNGKQETYGVGDKITGTRAILESVASDRVLLKQSGRLETLMLEGFKYNQSNQRTRHNTAPAIQEKKHSEKVIDQRDNRALRQSAMQLKNDINNDPGKITEHLKIVPKRQNGGIVGYQLMPGKKPEFFRASGLKSGDIAVQMNGLDLTIPSEAAQALQALKQDTELSLLVERNGEITEILFSIQE